MSVVVRCQCQGMNLSTTSCRVVDYRRQRRVLRPPSGGSIHGLCPLLLWVVPLELILPGTIHHHHNGRDHDHDHDAAESEAQDR